MSLLGCVEKYNNFFSFLLLVAAAARLCRRVKINAPCETGIVSVEPPEPLHNSLRRFQELSRAL